MRKLENVTLKELLENCPTITEGTCYLIKWYKDRKNDYGDFWRDKESMKKLAAKYVSEFKKISKDTNLHELTIICENEVKSFYKDNYNPFLYGEYAYKKAVRCMKEFDEMVAGF